MTYVTEHRKAFARLKSALGGAEPVLALCVYVDKFTRRGKADVDNLYPVRDFIQENAPDVDLKTVFDILILEMDIRTTRDIRHKLYANLLGFEPLLENYGRGN